VQAKDFYESIRTGLIAMLPRLMRFADLLAGDRRAGAGLLGRALRLMLVEEHRYQRGTALECWAFAEIYRLWLEERRDRAGPASSTDWAFALHFIVGTTTFRFLRASPPQR
jgi:RNA polymerase sigma-70 factor (ECF subfamily)